MAGDYSNVTFDPLKHFSSVLMQQGRVQLDADWNEQSAILTHFLRSLARDLIGPHGGPGDGFDIGHVPAHGKNGKWAPHDVAIKPGRYYVQGILCENDGAHPLRYTAQPDHPEPTSLKEGTYLVYLDVWEREIVALQDDDIRETALGGPDTAARSKVVWQVKALEAPDEKDFDADDYLSTKLPPSAARLQARALRHQPSDDLCVISPDARYRGTENQLYRVEIHRADPPGQVTFKWSRDNGSALLAVTSAGDHAVTVENLGRDDRLSPHVGDWVEILDDADILEGRAGPLVQVRDISLVDRLVTLGSSVPPVDPARRTLLRRWDQHEVRGRKLVDGAVPVSEDHWLGLEDGVQVRFEPKGTYHVGDHWLVPARTATGDVIWPGPPDRPDWQPPRGVRHHHAPLRLLTLDAFGQVTLGKNYRRTINTITSAAP
ncbi:hypothetical protein IOD14_15445 [Streptomyces sp. A2-16]|uniref:DUF6519 domain-containing protein n=1 Tax=Streptomyces sp. A2-16 TaxID=2781734 RepID=UPI001BAEE1D5|nr:DUF6519 domain-containing protein [Streptomyces sp. A2-16]QUC58085.1 hypothetical protein IOD14_15445 [Streptomyces sp. A2-16]